MPQVDLETLVSVCGGGGCDRKIACETLADGHPPPEEPDLPETVPDLPPDSFWLSKDAELDWFDRNAFYERKESTKGNSNSNPNPGLNSNSSSQRFSLSFKSKASIIGLPKPQKSCFADVKLRRHCKPANIRLFPKRSEPQGKSAVPVAEPSSPKVSCMGRVRSKRDRNRQSRNRQRQCEPAKEKEKAVRKTRPGIWTSLRGIFRSGRKAKQPAQAENPPKKSQKESPPQKSVTSRASDFSATENPAEAPGLGGVKRFASGRRSDSWGIVDMDLDTDVAKSGASDADPVWVRRGLGPPKELECRRKWESVGPASV